MWLERFPSTSTNFFNKWKRINLNIFLAHISINYLCGFMFMCIHTNFSWCADTFCITRKIKFSSVSICVYTRVSEKSINAYPTLEHETKEEENKIETFPSFLGCFSGESSRILWQYNFYFIKTDPKRPQGCERKIYSEWIFKSFRILMKQNVRTHNLCREK